MTEAEQIKALEARVTELEEIIAQGQADWVKKNWRRFSYIGDIEKARSHKQTNLTPSDFVGLNGVTITKVEGTLRRIDKECSIQVDAPPLP